MLVEGAIFCERYEVISKIGQGCMSTVFLCFDKNTKRNLAIKEIIKKDKSSWINSYAYYEMYMLRNVSHPSIPRIVDFIDTKEAQFIVMDYIEGRSLSQILLEEGQQDQNLVINWAIQIADALKSLHNKGIIYCDVKPSNIILSTQGIIHLIDFGFACYCKTKRFELIGTTGYAAPEQYLSEYVDERTDIYGFGATLYSILTGKNPSEPPYEMQPICTINKLLKKSLELIILKCTKPNRVDRFNSFVEILDVLNNIDICENLLNSKIWGKRKMLKRFPQFNNIKLKETQISPVHDEIHIITPNTYDKGINETSVLKEMNYTMDNKKEIEKPSAKNYIIYPNISKKTIFFSYCSKDDDLADILFNHLSTLSNVVISRYTRDVEYKESFKEFMERLKEHDYVVMIISDNYLKSHACMFEVGELLKDKYFRKKILFIIVHEEDRRFYKNIESDVISAKVYDVIERNEYILFWEEEYRKIKEKLDKIQSDVAKIEPLRILREIRKIIDSDLSPFLEYLSDVKGYSFSQMYETQFKYIKDEIGIEE